MRFLKPAGYAVMALALAGGWGFLYWLGGAVDIDAIERTRGALSDLRGIDSRWNARLLDATAPAAYSHHRSAYSNLEVRVLALNSGQAGRALVGLRAALDEKADLVDQHAAARDALAAAARADPVDEAKVTEMRAAAATLHERAWQAPTASRMGLVARELDRALDEALGQAELFRVLLLYYSGILLAVLAYVVWRLAESRRETDRANAQLRDANETLEARVQDRTREVSNALARLKESEAMLVQSEKMSSLGQMVAGLVHEVNTPLAYVKASMEGLKRRVPEVGRLATETDQLLALLAADGVDEAQLAARFASVRALLDELRARKVVEEIGRQVEDGVFGIAQISELVGSLKNFSRLDRSQVAQVDLHEGLESSLRIARHQLKTRAVAREFGKIARVSCSPSQINQVFLNLISNAAQATPEDGGRITVRTSMPDAAHVAVEIADNGHGIPAEVLPKIFDPFFTTKPVGKGTGLGLSICYRIVENHGGKLQVDSRPGLGTRFTVLLPVAPPAP
ncbi:MAG: sensor histidine kinase [Betaproteobacteria bacterium]